MNKILTAEPMRYVPLPKAARQLGVSLGRAVDLIRRGQLRARLVGGRRWFVRGDALVEYRRQQCRAA